MVTRASASAGLFCGATPSAKTEPAVPLSDTHQKYLTKAGGDKVLLQHLTQPFVQCLLPPTGGLSSLAPKHCSFLPPQ